LSNRYSVIANPNAGGGLFGEKLILQTEPGEKDFEDNSLVERKVKDEKFMTPAEKR